MYSQNLFLHKNRHIQNSVYANYTINPLSFQHFQSTFASPVAGLSINLPFSSNLEPWHGQSQVCSALFHFKAHPRCGHLLGVGINKFKVASIPFITSWGFKILRCGENTSTYSFSFPKIISESIVAATIDDVIHHLLNPVATYISSVFLEYLPI